MLYDCFKFEVLELFDSHKISDIQDTGSLSKLFPGFRSNCTNFVSRVRKSCHFKAEMRKKGWDILRGAIEYSETFREYDYSIKLKEKLG